MEKKNSAKGKTAAVAAVTAASMLVGGAFSSPADLLDGADLVSCMSSQTVDDDGADDGTDGGDYDENKSRRTLSGVRSVVLSMPTWVRATVCLPLWGVGTALLWVLSTVTEAFINPVLGEISGWLAMLVVILLAFAMAVKSAFPDLKLKKILNKRTIPVIGGLILVFALVDSILPLVWKGYSQVENFFRLGGSLLSLVLPLSIFVRREKKRRESLTPEEPSFEEQMSQSRREVLELVDSIK